MRTDHLEPNMSVTMCVGMLMLAMLFLGGMKIKHFLVFVFFKNFFQNRMNVAYLQLLFSSMNKGTLAFFPMW